MLIKLCPVEGCSKQIEVKGYCKTHERKLRLYGDPNTPNYPKKKKIEFSVSEDGCYINTSHKRNRNGYPAYSDKGTTKPMSRFIYEQMYGEIPMGLVVRHTCDNRECINPEHLILGTQKDNMNDMMSKNRNNQPRGEKSGKSKLTEEQVRQIRRLLDKGVDTKEIARKFNIHFGYVTYIRTRKVWKHVD
ncbi:HNH endonuclease [Cytobacillus oceanisediminis]|uniref:HNH endonuclease n=1 Tax=Cytobacillus oceanisediminis TaxID=665099 RepID=UPI001C222FC3|nr:HNH endonuclease [Cytobacillus oceanisediminis]MBU8770315.1 HNH endonuclease [Cytobacillus oceanisediminis]